MLIKWLTALVVFGGWGLHLLLSPARSSSRAWLQLGAAGLVTLAVFLPWQLYIMHTFPAESAAMYAHNRRHIFEALDGHFGGGWYHLLQLPLLYERLLIAFALPGAVLLWRDRRSVRPLTIAYFAMILVIYGFFTAVATMMPAFTYPVHALVWTLIGYGLYRCASWLSGQFSVRPTTMLTGLLIASGLYSLGMPYLLAYRSADNAERNDRIHNATVLRDLDTARYGKRIIINLPPYEDVALMFYHDMNAYSGVPERARFDSLVRAGHTFAAYTGHDAAPLPDYVSQNNTVVLIDQHLR